MAKSFLKPKETFTSLKTNKQNPSLRSWCRWSLPPAKWKFPPRVSQKAVGKAASSVSPRALSDYSHGWLCEPNRACPGKSDPRFPSGVSPSDSTWICFGALGRARMIAASLCLLRGVDHALELFLCSETHCWEESLILSRIKTWQNWARLYLRRMSGGA